MATEAANQIPAPSVGTNIAIARPAQAPDRPARREASDWIEHLYREQGRRVLGICTSLLRDRVEAEDAAQQVFLSAYRARLNGAAPREPAAWLATIARNECWSRTRAATHEIPPEAAASSADPPDDVIQRAELSQVWQAISELPAGQREVLLQREIRGLSYDQLAESLSLSRPSVRSLLRRARQRLHDQVRSGVAVL